MQNKHLHTIHPILRLAIVFAVIAHFGAVMVYQFGYTQLPKYVTDPVYRYVVPWFHQNYQMFAPDPSNTINTFVYRVQTEKGWSKWKAPVYGYQLDIWSNPFTSSADMFDIFLGIGDALYNGASYVQFRDEVTPETWFSMPGFELAKRYVVRQSPAANETLLAFQVGVLSEHHTADTRHNIIRNNLFQAYPIYRVKTNE